MPQLDGLRTLAVFPVLVQHWFDIAPFGIWGVILFFVISGYLITQSILAFRDRATPIGSAAVSFFTRRVVRLYPPLLVLMAIELDLSSALRSQWHWYVFYMSNVKMFVEDRWTAMTPTWSLAVEQQFYIVWFAVCMLVPVRRLGLAVIVMCVLAPMFRFAFVVVSPPFAAFQLPANTDSLALGAMLTLWERQGVGPRRWFGAVAAGSIALSFALSYAKTGLAYTVSFGAQATLVATAAAWAVWRARTGFGGIAGAILRFGPVVYLGRISYGIYVYHMLTGRSEMLDFLRLPQRFPEWSASVSAHSLGFPLHVATTIVLAALSYHFLERPLLSIRWRGRRGLQRA